MRFPLLLPLIVIVIVLGSAHSASAATDYTQVTRQLTDDLKAVSINTPVWLAQRLPTMMAQSGLGSGVALSDDAGTVSIGLILGRVGLLNGFSQVGFGTEALGFEEALPDNLPWPQFGVTVGVGLGYGLELGVDAQFIPEMDVGLFDDVSMKVGMFSIASALRWRINQADGGIPAVTLGVGGSYYRGVMAFGAGYADTLHFEAERTRTLPDGSTGTVTGTFDGEYSLSGAPEMNWELFQVGPELRVAWSLGPVRPYFGFGFAMTFGDVTGGADVRANATATFTATSTGAGQTVSERETVTPVDIEESSFVSVPAARYLMRPFIGMDLVFGPVAITLQVDYALASSDPSPENLSTIGQSFSDGFLYSDASKNAVLAEALVGTLALRFIF
jgi:hypothetical protein